MWRLGACLTTLLVLTTAIPLAAQDPNPSDDVVAIIRWNNAALPAAYWSWDASGLGEYLTDGELNRRLGDIGELIAAGGELWFELKDFQVLSVTLPGPDRATVDTIETWYEWAAIRGTTVERQWTAPERYELRLINGRWYISEAAILAELPPFQTVQTPAAAPPAAPPPARVAPAPAPAAPPPAPAPRSACCRVCTTGKACGNTCISRSFNCRQPAGCACDGSMPGYFGRIYDELFGVVEATSDEASEFEEGAECEVEEVFAAASGGRAEVRVLHRQ